MRNTLPLLLNTLICLAISNSVLGADTKSNDKCLDKCEVYPLPNGEQSIRCGCSKISKEKKDWSASPDSSMAPTTPKKRAQYIGVSAATTLEVQQRSCMNTWKNRTFENIKEVTEINTIPICECLNYRARFPLIKECGQSLAGEKYCEFKIDTKRPHKDTPLRKISWLDIQSCEIKKNNYRKPASCAEAECKLDLPKCAPNFELSNMADPGSCCPKYFCKKREV